MDLYAKIYLEFNIMWGFGSDTNGIFGPNAKKMKKIKYMGK